MCHLTLLLGSFWKMKIKVRSITHADYQMIFSMHSWIYLNTITITVKNNNWLKYAEFYHNENNSPLNNPLMPPIFFTIWANFVYWVISSWTSRTETPAPRATLCERPGWRVNSLAPSWLSNSALQKHQCTHGSKEELFIIIPHTNTNSQFLWLLRDSTLIVHAVHDGHEFF